MFLVRHFNCNTPWYIHSFIHHRWGRVPCLSVCLTRCYYISPCSLSVCVLLFQYFHHMPWQKEVVDCEASSYCLFPPIDRLIDWVVWWPSWATTGRWAHLLPMSLCPMVVQIFCFISCISCILHGILLRADVSHRVVRSLVITCLPVHSVTLSFSLIDYSMTDNWF